MRETKKISIRTCDVCKKSVELQIEPASYSGHPSFEGWIAVSSPSVDFCSNECAVEYFRNRIQNTGKINEKLDSIQQSIQDRLLARRRV